MKKFISIFVLILCIACVFALTACNDGDSLLPVTPPSDNELNFDDDFEATSNVLLVYFSRTGTTENVANTIKDLTGADIFEVERKQPYPQDYTSTTEVAKEELDNNIHPTLSNYLPKSEMEKYDTIIVGFPIWWGTAPMPIFSFLNYYDLSGKNIYTFCTAASSPIGPSTKDIIAHAKGATVVEGKKFTRNDSSIRSWVESINLLKE